MPTFFVLYSHPPHAFFLSPYIHFLSVVKATLEAQLNETGSALDAERETVKTLSARAEAAETTAKELEEGREGTNLPVDKVRT